MNYVRVDEAQTIPMGLFYFLYPIYENEDEPVYDDPLLFSQPFDDYEDASKFAMSVLKAPEVVAAG